jgi:hypothetical protein
VRSYRIAGWTNEPKRSFVHPTFLALVSAAFWMNNVLRNAMLDDIKKSA